jgi:hypothetical protein
MMNIVTHPTWANWFVNHPSNDAGNKTPPALSSMLDADSSIKAKLKDLVEDIDTVILAADTNRKLALFHSPKNFGGTRTRPDDKVACLDKTREQSNSSALDLESDFQSLRIRVPEVLELAVCMTANEVAALEVPGEDTLIGMEGSAIYIPASERPNIDLAKLI